ncbi:hypothetical protein TNCV_2863861 [Trichonephila clavipes]|nr:hypothetical protein TNCV_2863861 [Trichonephila clavipes]
MEPNKGRQPAGHLTCVRHGTYLRGEPVLESAELITSRLTGAGSLLPPVYGEAWAKGHATGTPDSTFPGTGRRTRQTCGGLVYDTLDKANLFAETLEETFTENPEPYDDDHIEDVERQVRRFFRTTSFQPPPLTSPGEVSLLICLMRALTSRLYGGYLVSFQSLRNLFLARISSLMFSGRRRCGVVINLVDVEAEIAFEILLDRRLESGRTKSSDSHPNDRRDQWREGACRWQ